MSTLLATQPNSLPRHLECAQNLLYFASHAYLDEDKENKHPLPYAPVTEKKQVVVSNRTPLAPLIEENIEDEEGGIRWVSCKVVTQTAAVSTSTLPPLPPKKKQKLIAPKVTFVFNPAARKSVVSFDPDVIVIDD